MKQAIKVGAALVCCAGLAGCLGGGSGGGGGTAGGGAATGSSLSSFSSKFNQISGQQATLTALTGTASYTGEVSVRTQANSQNADEAVVGDLDMDINFDANASPITATASNFSGEVNGVQTDITGSLSTANAQNQVNAISATNTGVGTITGLSVGLEGTLSDPTGTLTGDALLTLQGTFRGNNGASINGASGAIIRPSSGPEVL